VMRPPQHAQSSQSSPRPPDASPESLAKAHLQPICETLAASLQSCVRRRRRVCRWRRGKRGRHSFNEEQGAAPGHMPLIRRVQPPVAPVFPDSVARRRAWSWGRRTRRAGDPARLAPQPSDCDAQRKQMTWPTCQRTGGNEREEATNR
jgi:hypothetical protein